MSKLRHWTNGLKRSEAPVDGIGGRFSVGLGGRLCIIMGGWFEQHAYCVSAQSPCPPARLSPSWLPGKGPRFRHRPYQRLRLMARSSPPAFQRKASGQPDFVGQLWQRNAPRVCRGERKGLHPSMYSMGAVLAFNPRSLISFTAFFLPRRGCPLSSLQLGKLQ